ncbi:MAG: T9SS type A sorting domain-containing protein [Balneolaceae bacterium]|nr:T9SS type A sorting domain-containing protein [Balneolaceae bacterium]
MNRLIGIALVFLVVFPPAAQGQEFGPPGGGPVQQEAAPQHPLFESIGEAYRQDRIDRNQLVLFQLYASIAPERLPGAFRGESGDPVKCGVPVIRSYYQDRHSMSPSAVRDAEQLLSRNTQAQQTYLTPGGKFKIHYDLTGPDAVPAGDTDPANGVPDYVDWTAAAVDSSWRHEVQRLGFTDPVTGGADPYPIFIENINSYGYTDYGRNRGLSADTYIVIHNNFEDFPQNTDPEGDKKGSVKVTVAHELKHAIQYANSEWYGWPGNPDSPHGTAWSEMDATLMEEIVYDNVNDYYNYIRDGTGNIFLSADHDIPVAYDAVTWFIYFWERYGDDFWPAVWNRIGTRYSQQKNISQEYLTMTEAITQTLEEEHGATFAEALVESHLWHYASGSRAPADYGFDERAEYPDAAINVNLAARDSIPDDRSLAPLSADYVEVVKGEPLLGYVRVISEFQNSDVNVGVIGYFSDGSVRTLLRPGNSSGLWDIRTTWPWEEITSLGIVAANSNGGLFTNYRVKATLLVPETITLQQNYPNPFNPTTTITFTLSEATDVILDVYNAIGRKVATLRDGKMDAGFYELIFSGRNLSSGVYFYRLVTDQRVIVKKMTLIK